MNAYESGALLAELLQKYQSGKVLSDEELSRLNEGATFLWRFNNNMGYFPESAFYSHIMESTESYIQARKENA